MAKFEKYKRESEFSYSFGMFPTFELIKHKSNYINCIITHSKLKKDNTDVQKLYNLCKENNINIYEDDKTINKLKV